MVLTFTTFSTELDYDTVKLYSCSELWDCTWEKTLSGYYSSPQRLSFTGNIMIHFKSDSRNTAGGFTATYNVVNLCLSVFKESATVAFADTCLSACMVHFLPFYFCNWCACSAVADHCHGLIFLSQLQASSSSPSPTSTTSTTSSSSDVTLSSSGLSGILAAVTVLLLLACCIACCVKIIRHQAQVMATEVT